jgi:hypothetical protein
MPSSKEKDEFLGQNSNPKKKMKCRVGIHYNETTGAYQQCLQEHYTEEHAKLHPEQAAARQVALEAAGPWRDYHPLADTSLSVNEDEWNSRAQAGHFPACSQLDYFEEPQEQHANVQEVVQDFRRARRRNRISFSTDGTIDNNTEPSSATEEQRPRKLLARRKMRSYCSSPACFSSLLALGYSARLPSSSLRCRRPSLPSPTQRQPWRTGHQRQATALFNRALCCTPP